jgi:UDP-3-O-[3-hydroxymyristoyl] glucosamine N-acyltransferase
MEFSIIQIATLLDGEIVGNKEITINNFAKIEEGKSGSISFLANPKYESHLYTTKASVVIVSKSFVLKQPTAASLIKVDDPYLAMSTLMLQYKKISNQAKSGSESPNFISQKATVANNAFIGAFSYISDGVIIGESCQISQQVFLGKNVKIGENTVIYPGAKVYDDCQIGDYCTIHAGAVIGADGFGFAVKNDGDYQDIPQLGNVIIENNVSIGANAAIDRATMGSTLIRKGVKIDNLVQVGHNVEIGENTVIAALTAIAGSTKIGKNCQIGGQVGFAGHITIADGTKIGGQSGVSKSIVKTNESYSGRPLLPVKEHLKLLVGLRNLSKK